MKKLTVIMLVLLLLTMTGCGSDNGAESDVKVENEENTESTTETVESSETEFNTNVSIEETVIYDQDGITITADSLEISQNSVYGMSADLYLTISNNSDEDWEIYSNYFGDNENTINGIIVDGGILDAYLKPGYTIEHNPIHFYIDDLQEKGIYSIKEIQLVIDKRDINLISEALENVAPIYTNLH